MAAVEELDPIEKTLQQFFPCRLGKYAVEAGDGESEAFEPVEDQLAVTTPEFLARFLHSWPVEKVMGSEEFFEYQRSIAIGCPDWDYRAKIWKPLDNETGAYDKDPETGKTIVYFVLQVHATHTEKTKFFDNDIEKTGAKIKMPAEMGYVVLNGACLVEYLECWKVVDTAGNTSGDLCGVPGLLHAIGRPLPPPATELLAPIPPYTAPDNRDPNWKLRIQVFKQICKSHPLDKKGLKTLILRQKDELRQHIDYLNSIRNYCG